MKTPSALIVALRLSIITASLIHVSFNDNNSGAPLHAQDQVDEAAADDGTRNPYGITIKKSTVSEIREHVIADFLSGFPSNITFTDTTFDFWSQKNKQSPKGKYNEVDVKIPVVVSCTPRVSDFIKFKVDRYGSRQILSCWNDGGDDGICRKSVDVSLKQDYRPQEYIAVATVANGEDGVSLAVNTTYDWKPSYFNPENPHATKWEYSWLSPSISYELPSRTSCMLGMVHVELDCAVETHRYWWDTTWSSTHTWLSLEYQTNRHEASQPYSNIPYKGGEQYCTADWVLDTFWSDSVYEPSKWGAILPYDEYRGFMYLGNATKLESARMQKSNTNMGPFSDDEMIVHRREGDKEKKNRIWRCVPARRESRVANMTIPLTGADGQLQGYVGCIERDDLGRVGRPGVMGGSGQAGNVELR